MSQELYLLANIKTTIRDGGMVTYVYGHTLSAVPLYHCLLRFPVVHALSHNKPISNRKGEKERGKTHTSLCQRIRPQKHHTHVKQKLFQLFHILLQYPKSRLTTLYQNAQFSVEGAVFGFSFVREDKLIGLASKPAEVWGEEG
jgi:hypothetical protein